MRKRKKIREVRIRSKGKKRREERKGRRKIRGKK